MNTFNLCGAKSASLHLQGSEGHYIKGKVEAFKQDRCAAII